MKEGGEWRRMIFTVLIDRERSPHANGNTQKYRVCRYGSKIVNRNYMYNLKRYHYSPRSIVYTCHSTHLQRFNVQAIVFLMRIARIAVAKSDVKKTFPVGSTFNC